MPASAWAQTQHHQAVGADLTYSTDADDTEVVRAGVNVDLRYAGPDSYTGFRLERSRYSHTNGGRNQDRRLFLRAADRLGKWKYEASVGTDGHTALGSASIHNDAALRQEYFLERDKIESPIGVSQGLYYTFAGAAIDLPLAKSTQATLLAGVQDFTGENRRLHVRANLIQTLSADLGLSGQLRTRYFRNSNPREYDYYSPLWYAEVVPVLQIRRYTGGWRLLAAGGLGVQRDSSSTWRASRYLNLRAVGPSKMGGWRFTGEATYSSTPLTQSGDYHYLRTTLGITRSF
jgi:hypothetical protein